MDGRFPGHCKSVCCGTPSHEERADQDPYVNTCWWGWPVQRYPGGVLTFFTGHPELIPGHRRKEAHGHYAKDQVWRPVGFEERLVKLPCYVLTAIIAVPGCGGLGMALGFFRAIAHAVIMIMPVVMSPGCNRAVGRNRAENMAGKKQAGIHCTYEITCDDNRNRSSEDDGNSPAQLSYRIEGSHLREVTLDRGFRR